MENLQSLICQINERYLPINVNHDIRKPIVGRVVSAELVELPDGEYAVDGICELFESTDTLESLSNDQRKMLIETDDFDTFSVHYDRAFLNEDGAKLLKSLEKLSGREPQLTVKKALDPISVLLIGVGIFVAGSVAKGFFTKLGDDLYKKLKKTLTSYYSHNSSKDQLLDFRFSIEKNNRLYEVHVLLSSPNEQIINDFFKLGINQIDETLSFLSSGLADDVVRIVLEYSENKLSLIYAVRSDCVPVFFKQLG